MAEKKVRIKVGGYVEMSQENLEILMSHVNQHTSFVYSLHMGYVDSNNLTFEYEE